MHIKISMGVLRIDLSADTGSIANVVEAKAKAKAGRSDQGSVVNAQTVSLTILSANADNQSFNPSVLQSYKLDLSPQVFRLIPDMVVRICNS